MFRPDPTISWHKDPTLYRNLGPDPQKPGFHSKNVFFFRPIFSGPKTVQASVTLLEQLPILLEKTDQVDKKIIFFSRVAELSINLSFFVENF